MIRTSITAHRIDILMPSYARLTSPRVRMPWRQCKNLLPLLLSFMLGSLLTQWLFCRSNEVGSSHEQTEALVSLVETFHDESTAGPAMEPQTTLLPTTKAPEPTFPPYPPFVSNKGMILMPQACQENTFLLIIVVSSSRDFEARKAIRSSWGQSFSAKESAESNDGFQVVFSVGCDDSSEARVEKEAHRYGDIIRGNFYDVYLQNEFHTIKTLAALKWATTLCSNVKYILKVSSESFVNVPQTITWLRSFSQESGEPYKADLYTGFCHGVNSEGPSPVRNPQSPWFISESYWPERFLPIYASGVGILFSFDVAERIGTLSKELPPIHIEDVYVGIMARSLGILCADENTRFDTSYSTMLTECDDLKFCVIGSVPVKDMYYLTQNVGNLREIC